jgi:hypothetical protein
VFIRAHRHRLLLWAVIQAICPTLGCESTKAQSQPTPEAATASEPRPIQSLIDELSKYARDKLGLRDPRLAYVLIGCVDSSGLLDRTSTQCPGSVVSSFDEGAARSDEPAFVALGPNGIGGYRASRDAMIVLAPARCTPARFLGRARADGRTWSGDKDVLVTYGPRLVGGAAWSVERKGVATFSMSDDECVAPERDGGSTSHAPD